MIKKFLSYFFCNEQKNIKRVFESVYKDINGFLVSKQSAEREKHFSPEDVYGEINNAEFLNLLRRVNPKPGEVFYDLGSGVGKTVILAALSYPFEKVCGIEQIQDLSDLSKACAQGLRSKKAAQELLGKTRIEFIQGDFFDIDFSDANIVYINATAFMDIWQELSVKLESLKPGSRVLVVGRQLLSDSFYLIESDLALMTWGKTMLHVYQRYFELKGS